MPAFKGLWECLYYWAVNSSDRVALRHGERLLTYAELASEAEYRVQWLNDHGIDRGDRVIVVGYNSIDWIVAYMAVMRIGAIAVLANNRISPGANVDRRAVREFAIAHFME